MKRLIVNADDLGMSREVNSQIEECIRRGCITSSTLMANAPDFEGGVRIAQQYPQISVGVHLNIIEFAPLTNLDIFRRYGIIDQAGQFIDGAIFFVPINDELRNAIFEEWDAQISRVEATGIRPTHCDSHQHTHTIKELQEPLCQVLDRHHIKRVRRKTVPSIRLMFRTKSHQTVKLDKSKAIQPKQRNVLYRRLRLFWVKYQSCLWNRKMTARYIMTDRFYPFRYFFDFPKYLNLGGNNAIIELMCHPGNKPYQSETDNLIRDNSWLPNGYELISYNDL
jgi:predicted glycoside hydrolase/deacetylase ChbG (UPF0249 family)